MKSILYAGFVVFSTALVSCDKGSSIRPEQNTSAARARESFGDPVSFLLAKRGPDDSFTYASPESGRITKVSHGANSYTTYVHLSGDRRIRTVDFNGEFRTGQTIYQLNEAGRCTFSRQSLFFYDPAKGSSPTDSVIVSSFYTYDALGRLSSKKDVEDPVHSSPTNDFNQEHYYYFDKNGDLAEVKTFVSGKLWLDALFDYGQSTGQQMLSDRLHLNEPNSFINDRYLTIFGVSSTHLVRHIKVLQYPYYATTTPFTAQEYQFNYMLNRVGLVTLKQTTDVLHSQQLPAEYYAY